MPYGTRSMSSTPPESRFVRNSRILPMPFHPLFNIFGVPDLALSQVSSRARKIIAAGDLVGPLTTHPAESDPDLVGAHKSKPATSHATMLVAKLVASKQVAGASPRDDRIGLESVLADQQDRHLRSGTNGNDTTRSAT